MALRQPLPQLPATDQRLTVDEWFTLPDDGSQYELFEGVLCRMAPPSRRHQDITLDLAARMRAATRREGGYAGVAPLGVALESRLGFLPDVVYVAPGREGLLSDRGVEGAPDIVVEVLSPSTEAFDRGTKLRTYFARGVKEVWLVDPRARLTAVHRSVRVHRDAAFGEDIPSSLIAIGDGGLGSY
jgi:Uma2 family endonuclease